MKWLFVLINFSLLPFLLHADETEEPYLVKTKDFHVSHFSLRQVELGITAVIYNPYKAKVKLDEILIDVFIDDKKLGTILEAADVVKINKQSAFDLPLKINVNTASTLSKFFTQGARLLIPGKSIKVDYKGYVKVKALGFIPIKVKINQSELFTIKDIIGSGDQSPKKSAPSPAEKNH
ncbi:MAG: LEA type 2 family protein [Sphingobacteriales bacterium]|jgi:LEA14-like dessication related protein|nr:LEA type 2 family protein [Sphingobacteriales bacterium]